VRPLAVLLALVAALTLAACGGAGSDSSSDFEGEQREVASAVEDLQSAASDEDASEICRTLLAQSLLQELRSNGVECTTAVKKALDAADTTDLDVQSVQVNGTTATARVESGSGDSATTRDVRLAREGRNWKISAL
jgi:hypothetical protein